MSNPTNNIKPGETQGIWKENPSKRLEAGFKYIYRNRMNGLPFLHPKVKVHAIGFKKWTHFWFGVIVTPWAINLILCEGEEGFWKSVPEGKKLHYQFPAGLYDFISVKDKILGEYKMCSLLSPLEEIKDDKMAIEVAFAALDEIMKDEAPEEEGTPLVESKREINQEALAEAVEDTLNRPVSRRKILGQENMGENN